MTTAPGANVRKTNLEPVAAPGAAVVSKQQQLPADRVDGDVEVAVVVVVGRREAAAVDARHLLEPDALPRPSANRRLPPARATFSIT